MNEASFRRKLDPIAKNVLRKPNPIELVFKDILTFDAQNFVIGSLLKEMDIGKKYIFSKLISKASSVVDLEIKSRLQQLRDYNNNLGNNNNNNNNDNFLLPPPPPPPRPPGGRLFVYLLIYFDLFTLFSVG